MKHVRITNANIEPVFLAFRHNDVLAELIKKYAAQEPVYHLKRLSMALFISFG